MVIKGKAECDWKKTKSNGNRTESVHYYGREVYLNSVTYLFGSSGANSTEIPAGAYSYNFEFLLPDSLPYSMEGKKGSIRYKAEATLDIPWGFDYESQNCFTVVRYDDFNQMQFASYRRPCKLEKIKVFGCLCWHSKPVIMIMRLPRTGFGLGEKIPIRVEIINRSKNNVCGTEFRLMKTVLYNATSHPKTKTYVSTVTLKVDRGVAAEQTVMFDTLLDIPQGLPTSNSRFCKVFQIKYHINFKARTGSFTQSLPEMNIHIAIGNIGFMNVLAPTRLQSQETLFHSLVPPYEPPLMDDLRK